MYRTLQHIHNTPTPIHPLMFPSYTLSLAQKLTNETEKLVSQAMYQAGGGGWGV